MASSPIRLTAVQRLALYKTCVCNYMVPPPHGLLGVERIPRELGEAAAKHLTTRTSATWRALEKLGLVVWSNGFRATPEGLALMRKLLGITP